MVNAIEYIFKAKQSLDKLKDTNVESFATLNQVLNGIVHGHSFLSQYRSAKT